MSARRSRARSPLFAPLLDVTGEPFLHVPCQDRPALWDDDAAELDQAFAAASCRTCPALVACGIRRRELGKGAIGVWAGEVIPGIGYDPFIYDDELEQWAAAVGVTLRLPESDTTDDGGTVCRPAASGVVAATMTGSSTGRRSVTPSKVARRGSRRTRRAS